MDFFEQVISCKTDEEVKKLVSDRIEQLNNSKDPIEQLGFLDYSKNISLYEGFIPLNTRIKYSSMNIETYSMNTTDFFYEFAQYIRKQNIKNKAGMIFSIEGFANWYFGYSSNVDREDIFNTIAWETTTTDEEYFKALENNKIGDLKQKGAAMCTEYGALVQQLLSMYDEETYYCIGCANVNNNTEAHCFNIVKRKNDYALLDYSIPVVMYNEEGKAIRQLPFVGTMSNEEFKEFIETGKAKEFQNYEYREKELIKLDENRKYVVGKFNFGKENEHNR